MVFFPCVLHCKCVPEPVKLFFSHMEDVLNLFHRGIDTAYLVKMADVEEGIAVGEAAEVDPVALAFGYDDVAGLEITV